MAERLTLGLLLAMLACVPAAPTAAQQAPGAPPAPGATAGQGRLGALAPPTEMLFDGIAIGSMEAVRDAISRGANLNARNVLGQRPVDLAIDVGRSDMAFLLLSMMRAGQAPAAAALPAQPAPRAAPAPRRGTEPVAAPARLPTARLWANDGGAAMPDLGFMGFDASRAEGARPPSGTPTAPRRAVRSEPLGG
jgi:hypothetical protein